MFQIICHYLRYYTYRGLNGSTSCCTTTQADVLAATFP